MAKVVELSKREIQVLELVVQGLPNNGIAVRLFVTESTIKTHVSRMLRRTGLGGRVQLVAWYYVTFRQQQLEKVLAETLRVEIGLLKSGSLLMTYETLYLLLAKCARDCLVDGVPEALARVLGKIPESGAAPVMLAVLRRVGVLYEGGGHEYLWTGETLADACHGLGQRMSKDVLDLLHADLRLACPSEMLGYLWRPQY